MIVESSLLHAAYDVESRYMQEAVSRLYISNTQESIVVDENTFVGFLIKSDKELDITSYKLIVGEHEFDLVFLGKADANYCYSPITDGIYPEESNFWYNISKPFRVRLAKIFINNIGAVFIKLINYELNDLTVLGSIEVVSSKIDDQDLSDLFDYLLRKEISYWNPFSLTSQSHNDEPLRISFFLLIGQIEKDIKLIESLTEEFRDNPLVKLQPQYLVSPFDQNCIMDDTSIQWLFGNTDVLQKTKTKTISTLKIKNNLFDVRDILIKDYYNDTDIYENQVILGFFIDLRETISSHLSNIEIRLENIINESSKLNYITLSLLQERKFFDRQKRVLKGLESRVGYLHANFEEILPVTFPITQAPSVNNRFESKEHYFLLLKIINRWYEYKELSWGTNELFGGIRTLDKLYELFCLYKIIDLISDLGYDLNSILLDNKKDVLEGSTHQGIYNFKSKVQNDSEFTLYYDRLPDTLCTLIRTSKGRELRPDFVLKVSTNGHTDYIILDAKFKKIRNIKFYTFAELIPKYLHGIGRVDGNTSSIKALIILYPEDKDEINRWKIDFHKKEFSVDGERTVFPILNAIELPLNINKKGNLLPIIGKIIEKFNF